MSGLSTPHCSVRRCQNPSRPGYKHCEKHYQLYREWYLRDRDEAFKKYGSSCVLCGESIQAFLTIDHINGGGRKHRKEIKYNIYHWLRSKGYPPGFRTLCHNCNAKKALDKYKNLPPLEGVLRQKDGDRFRIRSREKRRQWVRNGRQRARLEAMEKYGGPRCSCCGLDDFEILTIDHINGGGRKEREESGRQGGGDFCAWLRRQGYPPGYQVRCHNCNTGRWINGGVCPHKDSSCGP